MMGVGLIVLLAVTALGRGGYAPWGTLVLEIGAAVGVLWIVVENLWSSNAERERRHRAWNKMPFHVRHPVLGRWMGRGKAARADIEILLPGEPSEGGREPVELDVGRNMYPLGLTLKRTGLGVPLLLLSMWLLLSATPLQLSWLEVASPEAHRLRVEVAELLATEPAAAPWSLAPFLTLRSLWLWLAVTSIFFMSVATFRRADTAAKGALGLLIVGVCSGVLGMAEWFGGLESLFGRDPVALRVSGSFGNPNHYAAFQAMLLSVSIGWVAFFRERYMTRSRRASTATSAWGLGAIAGLGVVVLGLGLVMSLSRSGLAFALAGVAAWVLLTRRTGDRRPLWALGLVALSFAIWIGFEPLLGRFENLEEQWLLEQGRPAVWRDSLPAVGDFWLTGSGLSSFRYIGASYRSFGGRIFYSWAHNDYLQLAIELGLPGLLLFAWIAAAFIRGIRRVRADLAGDAALLHLHSGFVAAVVAIALHSFTDFSLHIPANLALLALIAGVVLALEKTVSRVPH